MKFALILALIYIGVCSGKDCDTDSDCPMLNTCEDEECEHKDLESPEAIEIVGFIVIFIFSGLANAAGIGGGPILVPMMLLIFFFDTHKAIPLSQSVVASGSFVSIMLKIFMRHPTKDRPLILYTFMLHLQSTLLLGAVYGVLLNLMFPPWLILGLLTILLVFLCYNTFKKGRDVHRKEKQVATANEVKSNNAEPAEDKEPIRQLDTDDNSNRESLDELAKIKRQEAKTIEVFPFLMIILIYVFVILSSFIQGGRGIDSIVGIERCSAWYWIYIVAFSCLMLFFNVMSGIYCKRHSERRIRLKYDFDEHDIIWTPKKIYTISICGFVTGLLAGMLGLGGGVVMSPLMLMFNVRPEVTAATSPLIVFFTSSISLMMYSAAGQLKVDYAVTFMAISLFAVVIGIFIVQKLVRKYKKASILVFILFGILLLAAFAVPFYGIRKLIEDEENNDTEYDFQSLC